jgi:hypothetical protein
MGNDAALAAMSTRPKLPFEYFKQLFAQVGMLVVVMVVWCILAAACLLLPVNRSLLCTCS